MREQELEFYMHMALEEAAIAYTENEVPVGAIIIKNGKVIAQAHNMCIQRTDMSAHAELIAMQKAALLCGGRLDGCTLFVTLEPCAMCSGAAINFRLSRIVFGAYDENTGCCGSVADITDHWFLHSVETIGGILEKDCSELLTSFFLQKH